MYIYTYNNNINVHMDVYKCLYNLYFTHTFSFFLLRTSIVHPSVRPSIRPSIMTDSSSSWWKFSFMRKPKSQPKVLHEIPAESVSNSTSGQHGSAGGAEVDSQLEARLERIVDKTTGTKGRHVKVSHSGRYKEQKRVRTTLTENQEMFRGENPATDENQRVRK